MNSLSYLNSIYFTNKLKTGPANPTLTNLRLWLDAKDPSGNGTIISANTNLSRWIDKSGYNNNASALSPSDTSSSIQYQITGFNSSYPTFNFISSNRFAGAFNTNTSLVPTSSNIIENSTRCFIVATIIDSTVINQRSISFSNGYKGLDFNSVQSWGFLKQTTTGMGPNRQGERITNTPSATNLPLIWEAWFDATTEYTTFLNGNSTSTISKILTKSNTGAFNITDYAVGCHTSPTDGAFTGKISEILVYNGTMTPANVELTEAYLAYKWGLQDTLPDTNPYK